MDFLKKAAISNITKNGQSSSNHGSSSGSDHSKKSDPLDKAIDLVQEHVLKQGSQKNESAAAQAQDEKIASGIKSLFKSATGKNFPGTK